MPQPTSWVTSMASSQLKRVYKISFSIEKAQTTFCGLGIHQDIYKSQQTGCPSEEHVHVSASGQARDVLVEEEVSLVHGYLDTLPSAPLGFLSAL